MRVSVAANLKIRRVVLEERTLSVETEGRAHYAACRACERQSSRVHGRYTRRLAGVPWCGYAVSYLLTVRSFCCPNSACARTTFTEDFGDAAPRRARWTREAQRYFQQVTDRVGAEAGARLATAAGVPVSPDTLLRLRPVPITARGEAAGHPGGAPTAAAIDDSKEPLGPEPAAVRMLAAAESDDEELPVRPGVLVIAAWLQKWTGADIVIRKQSEAPGRRSIRSAERRSAS